MSRFLFFDLGGVLADVDLDRAEEAWVNRGYERSQFFDAFHASGAKPLGDVGEVDAEGMRARVEDYLCRPFSMADLVDIWGAVVSWRPYVGDLLKRVKVPYGVLSTIDPIHARALGPLPGAQPLIYSCDVGVTKPHPRIYEAAIALCPASASAIRYIDDLPENVRGACAAGLDAYQVTTLTEIEGALGDLLT